MRLVTFEDYRGRAIGVIDERDALRDLAGVVGDRTCMNGLIAGAHRLLPAVRDALNGDEPAARRRIYRQVVLRRIATLTPREKQVMAMVVDGKSNKQIAAELDVSVKTVEVHRSRVMRKTEAGSLANLVQQAIASGFRPLASE